MDAFFASVEQRDNREFRGKPLIVGGNPQNRGVVAACSYEARSFGVHSAMPCSTAARICPQAIFVRPRMNTYRQVSAQIMEIFTQYTPLVEPLSVDEAFLDVTINRRNHPSATILATTICQQIYEESGLTASAGVSFNKFLAKVASDLNKPNGISTITPGMALDFISSLPVRKFFGVGKVTEQKMHSLGLKNGADLRLLNEEQLLHHFGKVGSFLYNIVRAIDTRPVQSQRCRKSIGNETTLQQDTKDRVEINAILASLAYQVGASLERKKTAGYTLTLKIRYHDFTTITRSISISTPFGNAENILFHLPNLLEKSGIGTNKIRLLGLSISKLTNDRRVPRQLLLPFPQPKRCLC